MSLFSNYSLFKLQLERYIDHCKKVFDEIGDTTSAKYVSGFIKDLEMQRYNISVIGSLKRGKSTLLNTLMERNNDDISPISFEVCTSAIIKYSDKDLLPDKQEKAIIYFNNDSQPEEIPLNRIRDYVTEDCNPGNRKCVHSVNVFGDFPSWSKSVTIVDSPGQNSVFNYHDVLLCDFLPNTDAIIFLVAADLPLDGGDLKLLQQLTQDQQRKIFYVLTKIDELDDPDDLQEVKEHVLAQLHKAGCHCDKLYAVSAKSVFDAYKSGASQTSIDNLKARYGIAELEKDLERFVVTNSDQTKIMRTRVQQFLEKTNDVCQQYIDETQPVIDKEKFDFDALNAQRKKLSNEKAELLADMEAKLQKFDRDWKRIIKKFNRQFSSKSDKIEDSIFVKLEKGGLIGALFQSFKLKKLVQQVMTAELHPIIIDLEDNLDQLVETLNQEIEEEIIPHIGKRSGNDTGASIGGWGALGIMSGTVATGVAASAHAVNSAVAAFGTWQTAVVAKDAAIAANSVTQVGLFSKIYAWLIGGGEAAEKAAAVAKATTDASAAGTAAISAGIGAVVSCGLSIVITLVVQKILHIGLTKWQGNRAGNMLETLMEEMEAKIFKALDDYKDQIILGYRDTIEDMICDYEKRLKVIAAQLENDDPEQRKILSAKVSHAKELIGEKNDVNAKLPMLEA